MVTVDSRPFVFPREWPVRNSLVAHERHSRTRVCRHEVSNWKGKGLGARDLCVCIGADRGCTCQCKCGSRTFDRSEDCGKGTDPVDLSENASRILCQNIHWNSSADCRGINHAETTPARCCCDAGRGDTTGRAGSDLRSVCTRHATARATLQQRQGTCGRGQRQEFENAQRSAWLAPRS